MRIEKPGSTMIARRKARTFTTIACLAPEATEVLVAGTFNNWDRAATHLKRKKNGRWSIRLGLSPGRYEYKFIVDGNWCCAPGCTGDQACLQCVPNDFGTMNRVLVVNE